MTRDKNIVIKNIFYMLSYAFQEIRKNNYENINSENFEYIHDLFAEILIRGISNQLKKGVHKEYINNNSSQLLSSSFYATYLGRDGNPCACA